METLAKINGKIYSVKKTGNRYFHFEARMGRWLPVAASKIEWIAQD